MVSVAHMSNGCNNPLASSESLRRLRTTRQAEEIHILQVIRPPPFLSVLMTAERRRALGLDGRA